MATYTCKIVDRAVNASCAKCEVPLVDGILRLEDGSSSDCSMSEMRQNKISALLWSGHDLFSRLIVF